MVAISYWSLNDKANEKNTINVGLETTVQEALGKIAHLCNLDIASLGLFYRGQRIVGREKLSDVPNLHSKQTIYAIKVSAIVGQSHSRPSLAEIDSLHLSLQTAFANPQHRALLLKMASNRDTVSNLMTTAPGLKTDRFAQKLVCDPLLLIHWLSSDDMQRKAGQHASLIDAAQQLTWSVQQEVASVNGDKNAEEEDDKSAEEEEEEEADMAITQQRLAAALAAAGVNNRNETPQLATSSTQREVSRRQPSITSDMLQRAILSSSFTNQNSTNQNTPAATQVSSVEETNLDQQLEQLNNMGFYNNEENLNALRHAKGNVENALEFIISERERMGVD